MIDTTKIKQVGFTREDLAKLKEELETMFILSNGTVSHLYSLKDTEKKFPSIVEFFNIIRSER